MQMAALVRAREEGRLVVETMGETGRRFRDAFVATPTQAQVMLTDPFARRDPGERTIWYQSRYYRANLHLRGRDCSLRDIVVYSDRFPEPFLETPTTAHGIELRLPAVLDGYHWSEASVQAGGPEAAGRRAQGCFVLAVADGTRTRLDVEGSPEVRQRGIGLEVDLRSSRGPRLRLSLGERAVGARVSGGSPGARLLLELEWVPQKSALTRIEPDRLDYRFRGFDYAVGITRGRARASSAGVTIEGAASEGLELLLAQPA